MSSMFVDSWNDRLREINVIKDARGSNLNKLVLLFHSLIGIVFFPNFRNLICPYWITIQSNKSNNKILKDSDYRILVLFHIEITNKTPEKSLYIRRNRLIEYFSIIYYDVLRYINEKLKLIKLKNKLFQHDMWKPKLIECTERAWIPL